MIRYNHTFTTLQGDTVSLTDYEDKTLLVVNIGHILTEYFDKQFSTLETLQDTYYDRGLRVLGFPARNFDDDLMPDAVAWTSNNQLREYIESKFTCNFPVMQESNVSEYMGWYNSEIEEVEFGTEANVVNTLYSQLVQVSNIKVTWNWEKRFVLPYARSTGFIGTFTYADDPELISYVESIL
jgi:glutathione peroxidase-family protein